MAKKRKQRRRRAYLSEDTVETIDIMIGMLPLMGYMGLCVMVGMIVGGIYNYFVPASAIKPDGFAIGALYVGGIIFFVVRYIFGYNFLLGHSFKKTKKAKR